MLDAVPHERALAFPCRGAWLYGILSLPEASTAAPARGVLIVVGGPQYRAGSHRQFTLLARDLAAAGIPTMRFDYRGMGDSEGHCRTSIQERGAIILHAGFNNILSEIFTPYASLEEGSNYSHRI